MPDLGGWWNGLWDVGPKKAKRPVDREGRRRKAKQQKASRRRNR